MTLSGIKWFGIDFGFTIMNPLTMHHSVVIPEMYKRLGRESVGDERLVRWYRLRDSMGSPSDPPHQKVRLLKEYNRDKLYVEVFDNDPVVIEMYAEMEARERKPSEDFRATLEYMKAKKKSLAVVSEVMGTQGTLTISASLRAHGLLGFFDEIITPGGRFTPEGTLLDETTFAGTTKKDGSIYERLASYLKSHQIHGGQRAMVGDDPKQDIEQAKKYGFVTIQYCGIIDRGKAEQADLMVKRWSDLKELL